MNLVLDSSSSINLYNGNMFETVLDLTVGGFCFYMGTIVRGECGNLATFIEEQVSKGRIIILHGKSLTPTEFSRVLLLYGLGLGETECIVHAEHQSFSVCTDDNAARRATDTHLGPGRVLGSLTLIRECVCRKKITADAAYIAYESMKAKGAFLPQVPLTYFVC